jgi:signal transduction histidine kinase/ActR/RegA family two-component response regulator
LRDAAGRVVKWFGAATDIHDQKQTEERVRFLAEANALLASSLDYEMTLARLARLSVLTLADHCLIDVVGDDGQARRVATAHADPAKEELVSDLRRFPPAPAETGGIPEALLTGRSEIVSEVSEEIMERLARGDEHLKALRRLGPKSFMTVPLNARGGVIGAITFGLDGSSPGRHYTPADLSFAEDLARRAALAIDNARLYSRAQESNRAKDEFLATLSHELRTPLTPIVGWTQMLLYGHVGESGASHALEAIDKNSQSLLRLINDLLDMTSILSGKMKIVRAPVELAPVVLEAVETIRPQADIAGVTLDASCVGDGLPALVSGDRTRLVQVFWNLMSNAVKFSRAGGSVRVTCGADAHSARVEVMDEGVGIEREFLPRVFERFSQADGSTTRAHGGLGLGLALVKSFVEAHGGAAQAFSAGPGQGSRFTVTLPRLRIEEDHFVKMSASGKTANPVGASLPSAIRHPPPVRVLLIEDANDTLDMLRVVFKMRGYEVVPCASAEEALRVAPSARFDIIVSDIGLPRIDGYELIRRLRELPQLRDTPALALTGYAAPKDAAAARAAGFDAHVPKPVEPSALAEEIDRLLRQRRSGEEA